jgi:hypothetical protein
MEQVLDIFGGFVRVSLAGVFALTPGMLVWISVIAIILLLRQLRPVAIG